MPRMLLGPRPRVGDEPAPLPLEAIPQTYDTSIGLRLDPELVKELLWPWSGHARGCLIAMLKGANIPMAAIASGISPKTLEMWIREDREFAQAVKDAIGIGFSAVFESELYSRAMAGKDDRASGRLLEIVLKARGPEYREKYSADVHVTHSNMDRLDGLLGRYSAVVEGEARVLPALAESAAPYDAEVPEMGENGVVSPTDQIAHDSRHG